MFFVLAYHSALVCSGCGAEYRDLQTLGEIREYPKKWDCGVAEANQISMLESSCVTHNLVIS